MNYLWIDLWDKLCWISYTNSWIIFTLPSVKRVELVWSIKRLIKEKNISIIVVWLPYDLYGVNTKQLEKTLKFIDKIKIIFPDILIDSIDERFTTYESINILNELWEKDKFSKKDSLSAYLILDSYINKKK